MLYRYYIRCRSADDLAAMLKYIYKVTSRREMDVLGSPIILPLTSDAVPWTEETDYFDFSKAAHNRKLLIPQEQYSLWRPPSVGDDVRQGTEGLVIADRLRSVL